jgi:hypothetical protein
MNFQISADTLEQAISSLNKVKTKVGWIGKKTFSHNTMCVKWGLQWCSSRFTLLGVNVSVNISEIISLSLNSKR